MTPRAHHWLYFTRDASGADSGPFGPIEAETREDAERIAGARAEALGLRLTRMVEDDA